MEVVDKLYISIYIGYCIRNSENRKIDLINSEPKSELYECSFLFSYNVNQQNIIVLTQGQTLCYTVNLKQSKNLKYSNIKRLLNKKR